MNFSFIIPVYNRPEEIDELLKSICSQTYEGNFEVVIVEDGSHISSEKVALKYNKILNIKYLKKNNTGPGESRNYGMQRASYDYFLILDSDCLLPSHYLEAVDSYLQRYYVDCFGGPDAADSGFSDIQKAINYAMTSFLTTGGIRGNSKSIQKFEPRSFNMGLSRKAFEVTSGFGNIHPGEDPELVIRLWNMGFETAFIEEAFVYHKRRISWGKFWKQVSKFGQVRPIITHWHPQSRKITFWLPSLFTIGFLFSVLALFLGVYEGVLVYICYFILLCWHSTQINNKNLKIGLLSVYATCIQFFGYGIGFLRTTVKLCWGKCPTKEAFPHLFFSKK